LNKRMMEQLIKSGGCDTLGQNRATLLQNLPNAMSRGSKKQEDLALGFRDLFGETEEESPPAIPEFTEPFKLLYEKEALGFYVTGHPMDQYRQELQEYGLKTIAEIKLSGSYNRGMEEPAPFFGGEDRGSDEIHVRIAGMLLARKLHRTKKGDRMAFLTVEDADAQMEVTVFSEVYQASLHLLEESAPENTEEGTASAGGRVLIISGKADRGEEDVKLLAEEILDLDLWRQRQCRALVLKSDMLFLTGEVMTRLSQLLAAHPGGCRVVMQLEDGDGMATVHLGKEFSVLPSQSLLDKARHLFGPKAVSLRSVLP
jgi:DNA polymerase-3 subunit alpha